MDKETLPRWGWLLVGLFGAAILANLLNAAVLGPVGVPEPFFVVTVITAMAPVLVFVGLWYDDERHHYWRHSRTRVLADLAFVLAGALIGSATVLFMVLEVGLPWILEELLAMAGGFMLGWALFWWRNPDVYVAESTG